MRFVFLNLFVLFRLVIVLYVFRFTVSDYPLVFQGQLWQWWYSSYIYHYICNQYLSPLMLWVHTSTRGRCATLCDKVCQRLATGRGFSTGTPVSSINKTDRPDIAEILLKVALSTIKQTNKQSFGIFRHFYKSPCLY